MFSPLTITWRNQYTFLTDYNRGAVKISSLGKGSSRGFITVYKTTIYFFVIKEVSMETLLYIKSYHTINKVTKQ